MEAESRNKSEEEFRDPQVLIRDPLAPVTQLLMADSASAKPVDNGSGFAILSPLQEPLNPGRLIRLTGAVIERTIKIL